MATIRTGQQRIEILRSQFSKRNDKALRWRADGLVVRPVSPLRHMYPNASVLQRTSSKPDSEVAVVLCNVGFRATYYGDGRLTDRLICCCVNDCTSDDQLVCGMWSVQPPLWSKDVSNDCRKNNRGATDQGGGDCYAFPGHFAPSLAPLRHAGVCQKAGEPGTGEPGTDGTFPVSGELKIRLTFRLSPSSVPEFSRPGPTAWATRRTLWRLPDTREGSFL